MSFHGINVGVLVDFSILARRKLEILTVRFRSSAACQQFTPWEAASECIPAARLVQPRPSQFGQKRTAKIYT